MIRYLALAAAAKVCYDQFVSYGASKWLYALALVAVITAAKFEMEAGGCSTQRCTQADNRSVGRVATQTGREAMCDESRRVTWRVAYILAFLVFTVLNMVHGNKPRENLTMLLATWMFAQGTLGFLAFHRFGIWC
jgi:hypothetical protein